MEKQPALQLLGSLKDAFPRLTSSLSSDSAHVEAVLDVPEQAGVPFHMSFYTYGDELHITAGEKFWLEWFPDTRAEIVEQYREAAEGLLSGRYRIVEYRILSRMVNAQLQRPDGESWRTIGTVGLPVPFLRHFGSARVLQARPQ